MITNKLKKVSEEWCGECNTDFNTKTVKSKCPNCGKLVISCTACVVNFEDCPDCIDGSRFKEFGI